MHDPSYHDYRAEAQTHFELRAECIKKAALAYNKRQGELAKIYADQVRWLLSQYMGLAHYFSQLIESKSTIKIVDVLSISCEK